MIGLWVALAGGAGALARFSLDGAVRLRWRTESSWPTFLINVSGSLVLGVVTGLVLFRGGPSSLTLIAGTGFCGGYTTFSTASFETVRLLQRRLFVAAFGNAVGTLVITVVAGAVGLEITRL